jgi:hypothetical protein
MVYNQIWLNLLKKWTITSLATSQNQGGKQKTKKINPLTLTSNHIQLNVYQIRGLRNWQHLSSNLVEQYAFSFLPKKKSNEKCYKKFHYGSKSPEPTKEATSVVWVLKLASYPRAVLILNTPNLTRIKF